MTKGRGQSIKQSAQRRQPCTMKNGWCLEAQRVSNFETPLFLLYTASSQRWSHLSVAALIKGKARELTHAHPGALSQGWRLKRIWRVWAVCGLPDLWKQRLLDLKEWSKGRQIAVYCDWSLNRVGSFYHPFSHLLSLVMREKEVQRGRERGRERERDPCIYFLSFCFFFDHSY